MENFNHYFLQYLNYFWKSNPFHFFSSGMIIRIHCMSFYFVRVIITCSKMYEEAIKRALFIFLFKRTKREHRMRYVVFLLALSMWIYKTLLLTINSRFLNSDKWDVFVFCVLQIYCSYQYFRVLLYINTCNDKMNVILTLWFISDTKYLLYRPLSIPT